MFNFLIGMGAGAMITLFIIGLIAPTIGDDPDAPK